MARELRIGRPDLPRTYDDGGLVDLNSAPAEAIANTCGIEIAVATLIVNARAAGITFTTIDDVFSFTEHPVPALGPHPRPSGRDHRLTRGKCRLRAYDAKAGPRYDQRLAVTRG